MTIGEWEGNMDLRVEYYYDPEAKHWGFSVPSLRITGGGEATREEAEAAVREAILFALEGAGETEPLPGAEIGYVHITLEKAAAAQPA